jgi:CBS domain-containing protein
MDSGTLTCPHCSHENIAGDEQCAECGHDLTFLNIEPEATSQVERAIMASPVRDLTLSKPPIVAPTTPLREVIQKMIEQPVGAVLVIDQDRLVGIFTERDLVMKVALREEELGHTPISDWMSPEPETIDADDTIALAIHRMDVGGYRHLPVLEDGQPIGLISVADIMRFLTSQLG